MSETIDLNCHHSPCQEGTKFSSSSLCINCNLPLCTTCSSYYQFCESCYQKGWAVCNDCKAVLKPVYPPTYETSANEEVADTSEEACDGCNVHLCSECYKNHGLCRRCHKRGEHGPCSVCLEITETFRGENGVRCSKCMGKFQPKWNVEEDEVQYEVE
jgi:hypothetical protein